MKKILFLAALLVTALSSVSAEERLQVAAVEAPQGGETELQVRFNLNEGHSYVSYQFKVELPEGISIVTDEYGKGVVSLGDGQPGALFTLDLNATSHIVTCYSNPSTVISGEEGVLVRIPISVSSSLPISTELSGKLSGVVFSTLESVAVNMADASFDITVVENVTVLDEASMTQPTNAEGVKVRVKRTIKADEWSTICLPFAMTEAQVKAAFGNDVELGDFVSYDTIEDDDENIVGITVDFDEATEIEANHPYIIKVAADISEFTVDNVDIEVEDEPCVEYDNGLTGKKRVVWGWFTGTYQAETVVPKNSLFLSSNKYWYSKGLTKMKGFRAYFEFVDLLTNVDEAGVRIGMAFNNDDETTGISAVRGKMADVGSDTFDLQGRKVQKGMKPGLYVKGGKKMVVK